MILEGVVSNVANFGAFVDVGVHQDGLVHISAMTNKFISDPREIVKAGDVVKVKVMEVDAARKRISFTMKLDESPNQTGGAHGKPNKPKQQRSTERTNESKEQRPRRENTSRAKPANNAAMGNAFADAFAKAKKN